MRVMPPKAIFSRKSDSLFGVESREANDSMSDTKTCHSRRSTPGATCMIPTSACLKVVRT